ncbi:MAG: hypothetical protein D6707_07245, partial [Bacteroidetes bacterium]
MKIIKSLSLTLFFLGVALTVLSYLSKKNIALTDNWREEQTVANNTIKPAEEQSVYGFSKKDYLIYEGVIAPNSFLSEILLKHHVSYPEIDKLVKKSKDVFDVRRLASGKNYAVICRKDSSEKAEYFIYEPTPTQYVVFPIADSLPVYRKEKEITVKERFVEGKITSSLYESLQKQKVSTALAVKLSEIYAWTIDFYRIQKGDRFKIVYEDLYADNKYIGTGQIKAAVFYHNNEAIEAYHFKKENIDDYFDENGKSLRKAFLKAPLKFSRISSRYSLRRYHPVQKRFKAHYGTDYAAPKGTPIMAVGDGKVIESRYSKFNGNYVKIRHNSTYTTQYLHMSKRAVKVGQ